jgi:hypothetical protein
MHAQLHRAAVIASDREVLDREAEARRKLVVDGLDAADALDWHAANRHARAEREHRQHHQLVRGVVAVDVERRLGLGVAQLLRLGERGLEGRALEAHATEDVIAGAIDDAAQRDHPVAGQRLAQRAHDGDAAAHRALEGQVGAARDGPIDELRPVQREQHLVGGHHAPALIERALDIAARRVHAAHHLDEQVNRWIIEQDLRVGGEQRALELRHALALGRADQHARNRQLRAHARGEVARILMQQLHDAAADGAAAEQPDAHRHHESACARSSMMSSASSRPTDSRTRSS